MFKHHKVFWLSAIPSMLLSASILLLYPLVLYPLVRNEITNNVEHSAEKLTRHLSRHHLQRDKQNGLRAQNPQGLRSDAEIYGLWKIRLFDIDGRIIFSSRTEEIGDRNTKAYFRDTVMRGETYSQAVTQWNSNAEGETIPLNVVETYVPIMDESRFIGALELYMDITEETAHLDKLFWRSYAAISAIILALLILVVYFAFRIDRTNRERIRIIRKLQDALSEIDTLKGIIPICAMCKKIRDDGGYWHQVETYVHAHSEVEFTHSYCPDCFDQTMKDLDEAQVVADGLS